MHTCWRICCRKDGGVSCTTCCTLRRVFKYSINLLIKFTKCPACLIFPGTVSSKISSGNTGLDNTVSVSLAVLASRNPWTSLLYSSLNLLASLSLILTEKTHTYVRINIKSLILRFDWLLVKETPSPAFFPSFFVKTTLHHGTPAHERWEECKFAFQDVENRRWEVGGKKTSCMV